MSPQKVKVKRVPEYFEVGEEYTLACQVEGSRPPARITWMINYQVLRPHRVIQVTNLVKKNLLSIFYVYL